MSSSSQSCSTTNFILHWLPAILHLGLDTAEYCAILSVVEVVQTGKAAVARRVMNHRFSHYHVSLLGMDMTVVIN